MSKLFLLARKQKQNVNNFPNDVYFYLILVRIKDFLKIYFLSRKVFASNSYIDFDITFGQMIHVQVSEYFQIQVEFNSVLNILCHVKHL